MTGVNLARRVFVLVFGDDVDRALKPVIAVTFAGSLAGSTMWTFMGIWAVDELGQKALLPFAFVAGALLSGLTGYAGGWLSDRLGRRRIILVGQGLFVFYPLLLLSLSGQPRAAVAALALAGALGALGGSVSQAMVADLVHPERHEGAYATVRVAANSGVVLGPPLGAALLGIADWPLMFVGVTFMSAAAWLLASRFLPRSGAYAPDEPPERGSMGVILRDRPFLLFLGSAVFAWIVYVAYEVVLPVSLVDGFGYDKTAWGFLVWINPLLVALLQVRLTRATARYPASSRLVVAMLVMGLPFLVLTRDQSVLAVVFVVTIFVFGEMLWVPTAQAAVADLAPADIRGAYMGAFGSGPAIGFALGPLIGLQARNSFGDDFTWTLFPVIAVVAAVLGGLALLGVSRRRPESALEPVEDPSAVLET